ncbi:aquaporin family protein [Xylanimonas allomyrinae]|uniref:Aquaporin family protein n=1 Tax=Xylanimonas allomyrinae TaxID=2509459 RepID=A0A4P6EQZ4_9MICO|nr:MIP/aquaporin family protein [Xylanimonas allomyrinae]QAY64293.1 aquaporin family protein [Xylanimonas allomyrinae]
MLVDAFWSEFIGTATLILLGAGVVANVILPKNKGFGPNWLLINFGWGLAVFAGVYAAHASGAHLNPAVTIGLWVADKPFFENDLGLIDGTFGHALVYFAGQFAGGFVGAVVAWLAYKKHFDQDADPGVKLAVFSTGPAIRSYTWNLVTEAIATFVLVYWVLVNGGTPTQIGPLGVALVVVGIGASLGGPTGYAINPARDLAPRVAHFLLPIPGKGSSDWSYAWVPVVGPIVGAVAAGCLVRTGVGV